MYPKIRRSTLIFPVNIKKFVENAHLRGADAVCMDLEDSIPPLEKDNARKMIREAIPLVRRGGAEALVRINNDPAMIYEDIDAVVFPGLDGIRLPKVESAEQVYRLDAMVEVKERERGIPPKSIAFTLHIETMLGLLHAESIAHASSRIDGMGLGTEDLIRELDVEPSQDGIELLYAASSVVVICKANGIMASGLLGSLTGYQDLEGYEKAAIRGRQIGLTGASAIHPSQVKILNRIFSPSSDSVEYARRMASAFEEGLLHGTASIGLDGKMVDIPVYKRAKKIVDWAMAIEILEQTKAQALSKHS